ncbi:MAG: efflux RND transporter periplasmic adaptor subunit [Acidobacteria bacterium]|nr:efflux RND transporter periplasmic adaptor subunit [Acidobacteriota bacterium]MCG3193177.1 Macrolide export protein MacA [Thermoanaerobaculia bacterium]MCK6683409.1 efflux RND transporter periplasmic adaptor subunit [Thermoanaerobaculia bacterium]
MKKTWIALGSVVILAGAGAVFASRGGDKPAAPTAENLPFRLGKVQKEDLQVSVREVGVIDPETKVDVKSAVSGRIVSLKVRDGATVKKGDLLAEVEPDVSQAQSLSEVKASLTEAELKLRNAERELRSQTALFENGLIGKEVLRDYITRKDLAAQALKAAQTRYRIVEDRGIPISGDASLQKARVTSPMTGVVIKKGTELGETVTSGVSSFNSGTVLFTVADLDSLLIRVNLNEVDIAKVRVGQPVRISLDAYPQKVFAGKVRFVAPAAKVVEKIKVFEVEISLDEKSEVFHTGMSANVEVLGERRDAALSIPLEGLQKRDGKTVAYRLKKGLAPKQIEAAKAGLSGRSKFTWLSENWKQYFEPVPVTAGIATLEAVEVVAGLSAGDQIALEDPTKKKIEKDDENN